MIVDADGHVQETEELFADYLEPAYQGRRPELVPTAAGKRYWLVEGRMLPTPVGPGIGTFQTFIGNYLEHERGAKNAVGLDVPRRLEDLDRDGVDLQVLYPTLLLGVNHLRDKELATAMCRAYNTWLAERCRESGGRLMGMAAVPMQDPPAAAAEMRRALTDLGLVGVITPGVIHEQTLDQPQFAPFWAEADRLGAAVALHAVTGAYPTVGQELFSSFFGTHMVAMPFNLMAGMVALIGGGVMERHPRVRWAFMETGCGWVPYWAERLDEHWERLYEPRLKAGEAVPHRQRPSETLRAGNCWFACEPEERTLPAVAALMGGHTLMISSDYPHGDSKWPHTVDTVREREDLSEELKQQILGDNAARFYQLAVPAAR